MKLLNRMAELECPRDLLPDGLILLGYRGSKAHDMWLPPTEPMGTDDIDLMGVYVNPLYHYFGLGRGEGMETQRGPWDCVSYEVRKYVRLLLKSNPNVMSLLWVPERHLFYVHPVGARLREHRDIFSSQYAYKSFCGYAHGQLHRLQHWEHKGYMGAKRKAIVEKFGYDTKNAAHLIRLLRMGCEFLRTGQLQVERPDAAELLCVKRGEWTLQAVQEEADRLFQGLDEALVSSPLPVKPDVRAAEYMLSGIIMDYNRLVLAKRGAK